MGLTSTTAIALLTIAFPAIYCNVKVEYRLFANQDPNNFYEIRTEPESVFSNYSSFDNTFRYIILCHGWRNRDFVIWYNETVYAFMNMPKYVVIAAQYTEAVSDPMYGSAAANVPSLGQNIGAFIVGLHKSKNVSLDQIDIVGHSLGAHIAGEAGNYVLSTVGERVDRIFALDPAGPGYFFVGRSVQKNDAATVIAFHTSRIGLQAPLGNLDFYPNGGLQQRWCGRKRGNSHSIATYYFYSSVDRSFTNIGYLCKSYDQFLAGKCKENSQVMMGYWISKSAPGGRYYLNVSCPG